ncbi:MAG: MBL fold metallo-hydrolase [Myxococcales bacterium]|nr:MBL fold metallo-hydrolase [Myxococcales bacterium]
MRDLFAQQRDEIVGVARLGLTLTQLSVPTPTLPPAAHTGLYAIGERELVLVDVGAWSSHVERAVAELLRARGAGARIVGVLATHHHGDHVGGMRQAAAHWQVPVLAHPATLARLVNCPRALELGEGPLPLVDDAWQVMHTPGHADGHVCLDAPAQQVTIVGDMVAGIGSILIDPSDGDLTAYLASLRTLHALGARRLLPAHGPVIDDGPAKLTAYIEHRLAREALALDALRVVAGPGGADLAALMPLVYADTPTMIWPLAERSLASHLKKLVAEGRAIALPNSRWMLAA